MSEFTYVAIAIVSITSASRITRLLTYDDFPPTVWVRNLWDKITGHGPYALLFHCGYCMGLWAAAVVLGWGYLCDFDTVWWLFNSWLGVGYLAAILMAHDGED